ncbi:sensor domain-containing diguanylate cyclase [Mangrovitalea sediminis]|uniref:sensor domain-containing diguanylate cyclase n=1 Tax=Mangrovitalea sediminis TaxID=1982043 RepID=UPI000BE4DB56|nr:GGDEF domain-containing protein [Mangrovitalea sediminis]
MTGLTPQARQGSAKTRTPRFGIGRKLLAAILLTSSLITMAAIGVQLVSEYQRESTLLQHNLHQYFDSTLPSISQALWDADLRLVEQQLEGALSIPGLRGLNLTSIEGYVITRGSSKDDLAWPMPLVHEGRNIGTLTAYVSLKSVREKLRDNLMVIVLTQAVKTFLMSIVILWLIHRIVTRYLVRAARQLAAVESDRQPTPLHLGRPRSHRQDELDLLESAFNSLHKRWQYSLQDTERLNRELQDQSRVLEDTLARKTATLRQQTEASQLLSSLSVALMEMSDQQLGQQIASVLHRAASLNRSQALAFYRHDNDGYRSIYRWPMEGTSHFDLPETPPVTTAVIVKASNGEDHYQVQFPVYLRDAFVALLLVDCQGPSDRSSDDMEVSNTFYSQLARLLFNVSERFERERELQSANRQLTQKNAELQMQAETDPLTGILNRRPFNRALNRAIRQATRQTQTIGLLLVDIDHFKPFNDSLGHLKGDEALITVAHMLSERFQRATDIIARFGGEEFVVLMTDIDETSFAELAESFRQLVWDKAIHHPANDSGRLTVSIGGYWCQATPDLVEDNLIRHADEALYAAKQSGRNRVVIDSAHTFVNDRTPS